MILGDREWLYLDEIRQAFCGFCQLLILSENCGMHAGQCNSADDTVCMFTVKLPTLS